MCAQIPPGGSTPMHSGRKFGEPVMRSNGHDPGLDGPLVVVHVVDEEVEGPQSLDQSLADPGPLRRGQDPGDHVEGPGAVEHGVAVVGLEGDPDATDLPVSRLLALEQGLEAQRRSDGATGLEPWAVADHRARPARRSRARVGRRTTSSTFRPVGRRSPRGRYAPSVRARGERAWVLVDDDSVNAVSTPWPLAQHDRCRTRALASAPHS